MCRFNNTTNNILNTKTFNIMFFRFKMKLCMHTWLISKHIIFDIHICMHKHIFKQK